MRGDTDFSCEIALIRTISLTKAFYSSLYFSMLNTYTINSPYTILNCGDKVVSTILLSKNNIPIPKTCIALSGESALNINEYLKYPVIDKPPIGSWGRLVSLIENSLGLRNIIEHRELFQDPRLKVHLIQEYIPHNEDYRLLVLGDEILGCIKRVKGHDEWRTNVALGGDVKPVFKIDSQLEEIAFKVKDIVGGDFLGIDVMERNGQYYVIEVNGTPEFKGFMRATGINVSLKVAEYVKGVLKR